MRKELAATALIVGAVAAAYANAFRGDFQFDDYNVIVHNPAVHTWQAWVSSMPGIRPLLKLSYTLNWTSGLGLFGFHLVNVLCHAGSAVLAWMLCRQLAAASASTVTVADPLAITVALVFALHPAQTESVTYISGRSVALMGVLYLGAVAAYLQAGKPGKAVWGRALSPALFAAAMAARETAWTLPFVLLLVEVAMGRSWREAVHRVRVHGAVLAAGTLVLLSIPGYRRLLAYSLSIRTLSENLLTQINAQLYLLTRPLLFLQVNSDPQLPVHARLTAPLAAEAACLVALMAVGVVQLRRRPLLGAGVLWTFLHLIPTNSILPRLDVANDRQLYLALIGPALILSTLAWTRLSARASAVVVLALAIGLGAATALRNRDYGDEVVFWEAAVARSPDSARAWSNLGYAYRLAGEVEAARQAYQGALALDPDHVKAHFNLRALDPTVH